MPESQNIEYKSNWRNEYLKWICGFANVNGGKLYIGIDDNGKVAGIDNHRKLLEQLPNKFRDILGVFAEVNLLSEDDKFYLEVVEMLNAKFFIHPIDFKGMQRVERDEYPVAAVREMILNALVHRNYMGAQTQIRLYDDHFSF